MFTLYGGGQILLARLGNSTTKNQALTLCKFAMLSSVGLINTFTLPTVYLYGEAARDERRRALPSIRAGEYEGLKAKVHKGGLTLSRV